MADVLRQAEVARGRRRERRCARSACLPHVLREARVAGMRSLAKRLRAAECSFGRQWCGSADVGSDERGSLGEGEGEYGEGEEGQEVCAPDIESS